MKYVPPPITCGSRVLITSAPAFLSFSGSGTGSWTYSSPLGQYDTL